MNCRFVWAAKLLENEQSGKSESCQQEAENEVKVEVKIEDIEEKI
jgi:hypothetical protein